MTKRVKDLSGQKFEKLTALEFAGSNEHKQALWRCACECGTEITVMGGNLTSGHTQSCGCIIVKKTPKEAGAAVLLTRYKASAKQRGLEFALNDEEFFDICAKPCYYCGVIPLQTIGSDFLYNGIDRIDSQQGYVSSNCLPACKTCNFAKRDYTPDQFSNWAERFVQHQLEQSTFNLPKATKDPMALVKAMADLGVAEFEYDDLKVKFDPLARARLTNQLNVPGEHDMTKQNTAEAMERVKRANNTENEDLFWSAL